METLTKTIEKVKLHAKENFVPIVRDKTLEKIILLCKENGFKNALEIGTATGYSGLNILSVVAYLTTIEKNEQRFKEAENNFIEAGVKPKVTQYLGDAEEILKQLSIQDQKFDFVFLDGPKGQYIKYLPYITTLLTGGGILFADNILVCGLLNDEKRVNHKNRTMVRNMQKFIEQIKNSKEYETEIFEIEDGFAICKKQKD